MNKFNAIQQQEHKQLLFGSQKTHLPHFKNDKISSKHFIESILYNKVNPANTRQNNSRYNNIDGIEKELTGFQFYTETELACKHKTPLYKTQNTEVLVEYEKGFAMKTGKLLGSPYPTYHNKNDKKSFIPVTFLKNTVNTGGRLQPQDKSSSRLQELSLMNNTILVQLTMTST